MTTIFVAGDSTVMPAEGYPFAGWGDMLHKFVNAKVANHAYSGRSSTSFIAENRLEAILNEIKPGDYLFVQFGHNDQKTDERGTKPFTTFTDALKVYINSAREKGANPVLVTPMYRRLFENGVQGDIHGDYPVAMRRLAAAENVPLIDLHKKSGELIAELGEEKSKELFLHFGPGVYENYPDGLEDNTHFSEHGATEMARLVAEGIRESVQKLEEVM